MHEALLRRLARDHPDILDAYEHGKFPSVRQAVIVFSYFGDVLPKCLFRSHLYGSAKSFQV